MNKNDIPYRRKTLYLALTLPMFAIYIAIAAYLYKTSITFFIVYCALFIIVAFAQSYVCVYLQCPYVGKFAPCVGGFCLPASQIARGFRNAKRSKRTYGIVVTLAFVAFFGIIVLPVYFLSFQGWMYVLGYSLIVLLYATGFLGFICPVCATRHVCPGGQASSKIRGIFKEGLA